MPPSRWLRPRRHVVARRAVEGYAVRNGRVGAGVIGSQIG